MAEAETKAEIKAEVKERPAKKTWTEQLVQEMTLPTLMGNLSQRVLSALETTDQGTKQSTLAACQRDLRIWYEAQPTENRQESAKKARKTMENFKLVAEQFYQEFVTLSMQDV